MSNSVIKKSDNLFKLFVKTESKKTTTKIMKTIIYLVGEVDCAQSTFEKSRWFSRLSYKKIETHHRQGANMSADIVHVEEITNADNYPTESDALEKKKDDDDDDDDEEIKSIINDAFV
ncbi:conserved hypothetical protein [Trichinella spiralis]|uniref:hypothetical protein n=1 Tax=Trichinella spiralis TaxID=6334 RepID=UPI0001EFDFE7|nr:conserved hypothetical protein [Trichinella spiralis]